MIDGKPYIYIVNTPRKDVAMARRLARSFENMVYPVFDSSSLPKKRSTENEELEDRALAEADVLIICAGSGHDMADAEVEKALTAFRGKEKGRVLVFGRDKSAAESVEGAEFISDRQGGAERLLRLVVTGSEDVEGEMPEFEYAPSEGKFSNIKNILFIVGFIAIICVIFRVIVYFIK